MKSPWKDNGNAFDPMYDECIAIQPKTGLKTTRRCCVFLDNTADTLAEDLQETDREDIILAFRDCDAKYINSLRRGDVVIRPECNGKKYTVQVVTRDCVLGLIVKARSI